jgi:hypothetical protein
MTNALLEYLIFRTLVKEKKKKNKKVKKNMAATNEREQEIEQYTIPYNPIYSIPIRMPGMTLSVTCSLPTFQLTLKGGCDEEGIFEHNKDPHTWKINALDYALGRLVYDIIWEDGLTNQTSAVCIKLLYSTIIKDNMVVSKTWNIEFFPTRWLTLPKSRYLLKKITVKWQTPNGKPHPSPPPFEFKLAVASIPLKVLPVLSTSQVLDLSTIDSVILIDGKLNFSQVFGTWLVMDGDVDWSQCVPTVTYALETN